MNINIILPYKEIYTNELAGAVSLFVSSNKKKSKFKKRIKIFGSTNLKNPITRDYVNCDILDKPFYYLFGKTSYYLKKIKKKNITKKINN